MRLAPIALAILIYAWLGLALLAWTIVRVCTRRELRLRSLVSAVVAGAAGVGLLVGLGPRDGTSLLLSLPLVAIVGLLAGWAL